MESDSKITNPFFRGFRRENSDFFPMSSRHSAVFERNPNPLRSSGIFNNRRSSDAGIVKKNVGEPVLMDFIKRGSESPLSTTTKNALKNIGVLEEDSRFYKPRREKTESDIVLRNSEAKREARRKELREEANMQRRGSRNIDVNSIALSTATNSINGDEYLYIQVNIDLFFAFRSFISPKSWRIPSFVHNAVVCY